MREPLRRRIKVAYALGQLGWSILSGIIQVWLVWFYFPTKDVDIPRMIPQGQVLGFLTVIGLITMLGRFMDAITDPWIANLSDRSTNKKGRRIPFMAKAAVPFTLLTILVFWTPVGYISWINIAWLTVTLLAYYVFYTMYVAPYFALTAELGQTPQEKLDLSTYIALTWFLGYVIASGATYIWPVFEGMGMTKLMAIRTTFIILSAIALVFMMIPVIFINERKYIKASPSDIDFTKAILAAFKNKNFLLFEIFILAYGVAITIFQTGNIYYVTVLMQLPETWVAIITALSGIMAFLCYPAVNILSKKYGKKALCIFAMIMLIVVYGYCAFLGKYPFSAELQAGIFIFLSGIPFAIFGILPNAIVADIATYDGEKTGQYKEGMFYGAHTFMSKLGQMIAMVSFASLLLLGKDVGNDLGIRLTGVVAAVIGAAALIVFLRYDEKEVVSSRE